MVGIGLQVMFCQPVSSSDTTHQMQSACFNEDSITVEVA